MNKKGQMTVGKLVILAVAIMIGVMFIVQMSTSTNVMTKPQAYSEEINISSAFIDDNNINTTKKFYVTEAYVGDKEYKATYGSECDIVPTVKNDAEETYVDPTDVVRLVDGGLTFKNTTKVLEGGDVLTLTYTYCAEGYSKDASGRTTATLIIVLSSLALLILVIDYTGIADLGIFNR